MNNIKTEVELFRNSFMDHGKPYVIYGTGIKAQRLLPQITDYNIVGVMDNEKGSGLFCGIPIINYDGLIKSKVKDIIIVATPESTKIIYSRLQNICRNININIWGLSGELFHILVRMLSICYAEK